MESERRRALIVGLGNPGKKYEMTRHNLGQMALIAFAQKHQWTFKKEQSLSGEIAKGTWKEGMVTLLFPTTYMNLSGQAVKKTMDFFKIPQSETLILCDDIALPFGTQRFRKKGSAGGHNGLKSIAAALGTEEYQRLRLGIGEPEEGCLEDFVLSPFTKQEQKQISEITTQAVQFIEEWLFQETKECA